MGFCELNMENFDWCCSHLKLYGEYQSLLHSIDRNISQYLILDHEFSLTNFGIP